MEKKINRFKDTAMVVIKSKPETAIEKLVKGSYMTYLPEEYSFAFDLYINDTKVPGNYLWVFRGIKDTILDASTYREITEEDILRLSCDIDNTQNDLK